MTENIEEWANSLRGEHESEKEWVIKKSFIMAHHETYKEDRLLCLANCFINIEMYGCRYPNEVMLEVTELAEQLSELADFRKDKKEREANRIKFVQASSEPKKRASEDSSLTSKSKFPAFVSSGTLTASLRDEQNMDTSTQSQTHASDKSNRDLSSSSQAADNQTSIDLRNKLNSKNKSQFETLKITISNDSNSFNTSAEYNDETVSQGVTHVPENKPALPAEFQPIYQVMQQSIILKPGAIHKALILDSPDPVASFILMWAPSSTCTLTNSLSQAKHVLDSRQNKGNYELVLDTKVVAYIKEEKAIPLISSMEKGGKTRLKRVTTLLYHKLLEYLLSKSWLVIRKNLSEASKAVTNDGMQGVPIANKQLSKGHSLLKSLGWTEGTGLGSHGQGIKEPVAVETTINRQGLGFTDGTKPLKKCAGDFFRSYMQDGRSDMLVFSSEFSSEDRKLLHQLAQTYGLKSQSRGKGNNRCLTVSRKGVTLGAQIKELVEAGIYDCDWCSIVSPGTKVCWMDNS